MIAASGVVPVEFLHNTVMSSQSLFTDEQFMSAKEKEVVLRAWTQFLKLGCKYQQFTKALYQHLTLHCSFIAHHDRAGFHGYYFGQASRATLRFLDQFDPAQPGISAEMGATYWLNGPVAADLNRAMREAAGPYVTTLRDRFLLAQKQNDLSAAAAIAAKYGLTLAERPASPVSTSATSSAETTAYPIGAAKQQLRLAIE